MDEFLKLIEGYFRTLAIVPVTYIFLLVIFLYVMTRNYLRLRGEILTPDWLEDEELLDQLNVGWGWMRTRTLLTNRRVLQLRLSWFLSKRKLKSIALQDVHSVVWRRYTNWFILLLGLQFLGWLNPLALLLVLFAFQGKVYSVRFDTPFAQMPWTRLVLSTYWRKQMGEMARFYRNAQATWAAMRTEKGLHVPSLAAGAPLDQEGDFTFGRPVWVYIGLFMFCAFLQRVKEPQVSFDDYLFAPIFLGLPVAVVRRSGRDAVWAAILGLAGLLTIKFPGGGLLSFLMSGGLSPYFEEYLLVMLTLLMMVFLGYFISKYLHPSLSFLAVVVWLGFIRFHAPTLLYDYGLYSRILLAMAASIFLAFLEQRIGDSYGAAS